MGNSTMIADRESFAVITGSIRPALIFQGLSFANFDHKPPALATTSCRLMLLSAVVSTSRPP